MPMVVDTIINNTDRAQFLSEPPTPFAFGVSTIFQPERSQAFDRVTAQQSSSSSTLVSMADSHNVILTLHTPKHQATLTVSGMRAAGPTHALPNV